MAGTFRDEIVDGIRNAFCSALEIQQNYYGWLGQNPFAVSGRLAEQFFATAYRLACNREPPDQPAPEFTGGQCPGVVYNIIVDIYACVTAGCATDPNYNIGNYTGPISYVRGGFQPGSGWGAFVGVSTGEAFFLLSSAGPTAYTSFDTVNIRCTRVDGLPDTCGNPPPPVPTPDPGFNQPSINITYTDNSSNDVTLPVNFIFAPVRVNLKGQFTVPVRINVGDIDLQLGGDINLSTGDIEINFGNPNYNRNGQPTPDSFTPGNDLPDNPPSVPEPVTPPPIDSNNSSTTRIIRACIVTVTEMDSQTVTLIVQGDNPDIYAPSLGFINFEVAVGQNTAWTADIPIKNLRQIVECPITSGAIAVAGTPRQGVTWELHPVYAYIEDEVEFE